MLRVLPINARRNTKGAKPKSWYQFGILRLRTSISKCAPHAQMLTSRGEIVSTNSKHRRSLDWPDAFLRNFSAEELQRNFYLVRVMENGDLYCIACDRFLKSSEGREDHCEFHAEELTELLSERTVRAAERRSAGLRAYHDSKRTAVQSVEVTIPPEAIEQTHGPDCDCADCVEAFS